MGHREVKRVPLDFGWPLHEVWEGFLMPDRLSETPCGSCRYDRAPTGYSPHAQHLHNLWYGYAPFDPVSTGSVPLRYDTPAVRQFAERNVGRAPDYYGTGERAIVREAHRLAALWNGQWCHHLSQDDVDALVAAGRLMDFTHTHSRESGWQKIEPPVTPAAAQVNEWSLSGFGHDSINAMIAIRARCARDGFDDTCPACKGHGSTEAYEGQRAEAEAWEPSEPPAGDGWQLWETVTEGSPASPVFPSLQELAAWCADGATVFADLKWTREQWLASFQAGSTGTDSLMVMDRSGFHPLGDKVRRPRHAPPPDRRQGQAHPPRERRAVPERVRRHQRDSRRGGQCVDKGRGTGEGGDSRYGAQVGTEARARRDGR